MSHRMSFVQVFRFDETKVGDTVCMFDHRGARDEGGTSLFIT